MRLYRQVYNEKKVLKLWNGFEGGVGCNIFVHKLMIVTCFVARTQGAGNHFIVIFK